MPLLTLLSFSDYDYDAAFGIHDFWIACTEDDELDCPVEYLGSADLQDLE